MTGPKIKKNKKKYLRFFLMGVSGGLGVRLKKNLFLTKLQLVLPSASVERFNVSCMQDFSTHFPPVMILMFH